MDGKTRSASEVRLQLVELRDDRGPLGAVGFAPRVTVVRVEDAARAAAGAQWISTAVVGPRADGTHGVVRAGGESGQIGDLSPKVLDGVETLVLDDALVGAAARLAGDERRSQLDARALALTDAHDALTSERARVAELVADTDACLVELDAILSELSRTAHGAGTRRRVRDALDAARVTANAPDPEAFAIAADWDALLAERARPTADVPSPEVARTRLNEARDQLRRITGARLTRSRVEEMHAISRAVGEAQLALDTARRSERAAASTRLEAAQRAESKALRALGFPSYAAFLVAISNGVPDDDTGDDERRAAEELVAACEAALEEALAVEHRPSEAALAEREIELRARAAQLLGHFPGDDVAGELRARRVAGPDAADALAALRDALGDAGIDAGDDPVSSAEAWLASDDLAHDDDTSAAKLEAAEGERAGLLARRSHQHAQLEEIDVRLAALADERRGVDEAIAGIVDAPLQPEHLDPSQLEHALRVALGRVARGAAAVVRLPIVVGPLLARLAPPTAARALDLLGALSHERQVVVVSHEAAVAAWARGLGADSGVVEIGTAQAAQSMWFSRPAALGDHGTVLPKSKGRHRRLPGWRRSEGAEPGAPAGAPRQAPGPSTDGRADGPHDEGVIDLAAEEPVVDLAAAEAPETERPSSPGAAMLAGAIEQQLRDAVEAGADMSVLEKIARSVGARSMFYDPSVPLAACDMHTNIPTRLRCMKCGVPCCDLCSVVIGEPLELQCLECALVASGARVRRTRRRAPRL
jgi:hypothetical protein